MTYGHRDFGHPTIRQWLSHGYSAVKQRTNLSGLRDEVFKGEGRLSILVLLLELLGYVNHFDVSVSLVIWGEVKWMLQEW